jgi:ankyrin repeat protein
METTNNKQTALIVACQNANYEIIRHLILAKAEVNKPNAFNINPLATVLYRLVEEDYSF